MKGVRELEIRAWQFFASQQQQVVGSTPSTHTRLLVVDLI